jgi:hypothetical protein
MQHSLNWSTVARFKLLGTHELPSHRQVRQLQIPIFCPKCRVMRQIMQMLQLQLIAFIAIPVQTPRKQRHTIQRQDAKNAER